MASPLSSKMPTEWEMLMQAISPAVTAAAEEQVQPPQPQMEPLDSPMKSSGSSGLSLSYTTPAMTQMQRQIYEKMQQSMEGQRGNIDQLKKQLEEELKDPRNQSGIARLDLRPFAEALRQYGSQTAAVPANAPVDRSELGRKLQAEVTRAQQGLTDDEINFLRTQLADRQMAEASGRQSRFEESQDVKMFDKAKSDFLKPAAQLKETEGTYNFVRNEIATGQPTRINRALSKYARIMGQTGVLTDQDIMLQIPPTAQGVLVRAWTYLSGKPEGTELPEDIVQDMLATLDAGQQAISQATRDKIKTTYDMYATGPYASRKWLKDLYEKSVGPAKTAEAKGGATPGMPSQSAIQAELERRKKK